MCFLISFIDCAFYSGFVARIQFYVCTAIVLSYEFQYIKISAPRNMDSFELTTVLEVLTIEEQAILKPVLERDLEFQDEERKRLR